MQSLLDLLNQKKRLTPRIGLWPVLRRSLFFLIQNLFAFVAHFLSVRTIVGEISYSLSGLEQWFNEVLTKCFNNGGISKITKVGNENIEVCERVVEDSKGKTVRVVAPISPQETVYLNIEETAEQNVVGIATKYTLEILSYSKGSEN